MIVEFEIVTNIGADRRVNRKEQQSGNVFGEAEFFRRAEHTARFDAAHFRLFDFDTRQPRASARERHADADSHIGGTADDGERSAAGVDAAHRETFRVRMLFYFNHLRHNHVLERRRGGSTASTSRPDIVSTSASSRLASGGLTKVRSQFSENFMN